MTGLDRASRRSALYPRFITNDKRGIVANSFSGAHVSSEDRAKGAYLLQIINFQRAVMVVCRSAHDAE
jgi:hypothetical protein